MQPQIFTGTANPQSFDTFDDRNTAFSNTLASNFPRVTAFASRGVLAVAGTMYMTAISIPRAMVITNIGVVASGTGSIGVTNWWFALYNSSRSLLAQTADQGAVDMAGNTQYLIALSAAQSVTPGMYYIGVMMAGATSALYGITGQANMNGFTPILFGASTSGLTTTAPATAAAITAQAGIPYVWVT